MYSDGRYHQTLGYLNIQFGNLDQACLNYLNAIEAFQHNNDRTMALQLTERLNELTFEPSSHPADPKKDVHFKLEILRLCRLSLRHGRRRRYQAALNVLERALQLSDTLVDINHEQGQYCAAIVLGMMGKIYQAQCYYLFALASFKASLEAYQSLTDPDKRTQSRIATVLTHIARIAEITNHPEAAVEYYLDALWYWNSIDHQPQAKQIAEQLNKLCHLTQPNEIKTN